jgi:hypothetical protein
MIQHLPKLLLCGLFMIASSAFAADLDKAKQAGQIGERADGYLGLVMESAPSDVRELVADINGKRKSEYMRIARENDLSLEQVQALAGKKAIAKTPGGQWILKNGGWTRK